MADSYGMGEDLLLRYRLPEYYLSVFWHVLFVIVFLVLLWRLKKRMDRADRGGVISSVLLLAAWAGLWFGGAAGLRAGLEFLAESQPEPGWLQRWSQDW
ncbi:MAG: hypothetical protein OXH50_05655 [Gemmatimonadetes bacterium]|nr:hypothetical protein [Gemmatimonadota bacterium]